MSQDRTTQPSISESNRRDVLAELREHARLMRLVHTVRPGMEGRLLVDEIAANEIERLRAELREIATHAIAPVPQEVEAIIAGTHDKWKAEQRRLRQIGVH